MPITIALSYMVQYVGFLLPDTWLVRLAGIAGESLPPRVTKVICREFAIFSAILVTRIAAVVVTVTLGSKLLAYSGYEYLDEPTNGLAQVFFVAAVVLSVSPGLEIQKLEIRCALLRITPAAKFRRMKPMLRLLAVACALSLVTSSILTAVNIGRLEAEKLIEGTSRNSLEITFKLKGNPVRTTQTYILVLIQGDNYYVVEQENPAPAKPLLHVFPRDEVVSATIEKMNP
jgi:hypothetical protein